MTDAARPESRVALLVDGDNLPASFAGKLIISSAKRGSLIVKRVYCDATVRADWNKALGFRLVHAGNGKNAADLLMAIEAVDLALSGKADQFVLATSDRDFSHLAQYLCERGFHVLGLGEEKAPPKLRKACTTFEVIGEAVAAPASADIVDQVAELIRKKGGGKGMAIADLNAHMRKNYPGTLIGKHEDRNWRNFLSKRSKLFDCDPKGPEARVRLRMKG